MGLLLYCASASSQCRKVQIAFVYTTYEETREIDMNNHQKFHENAELVWVDIREKRDRPTGRIGTLLIKDDGIALYFLLSLNEHIFVIAQMLLACREIIIHSFQTNGFIKSFFLCIFPFMCADDRIAVRWVSRSYAIYQRPSATCQWSRCLWNVLAKQVSTFS